MTHSDFPSSMTSEMFTLVAQGGRNFFVHSAILAAQSQPLRSLISGDWKESAERKISLQDWDDGTVGRFVEFLYTGNYQYPDQESLSPEKVTENDTSKIEEPKGIELRIYKDKGNGSRPLTPLSQCVQPSPRRKRERVDEEKRLGDFDPSQHDYTEILLAHAKVYALAQYKDVAALRSLSLERLLMTLMSLDPVKPGSHIVANTVELLDYVYSHTDTPGLYEEPMRRVVSQFAALNYPVLQAEEKTMVLMSEGGDLVRDLMEKVSRRLVVADNGLLERQRELEGFKHLWSQAETNLDSLTKDADGLREKLKNTEKELASLKAANSASRNRTK